MSEISCIVCGGNHFRKGFYDLDIDVDVNSTAYNRVHVDSVRLDDVHIDIDVDTIIDNEVSESGDILLELTSEKENHDRLKKAVDIYKYICEDCGFIMSFTKEKNVESKFEEQKRKQHKNAYDWSNFGKNT